VYLRLAHRLLRQYAYRNRNDFSDLLKVKFYVTARCNQQCVHCGFGEGSAAEEIGVPEIERLWQRNDRIQVVSLSGGEPFVRSDIIEVGLATVRSLPYLMTLSVNTNGWYSDRVEAFVRALLPELRRGTRLLIAVSSHGRQDTHQRIAGNAESFPRKEATLQRLRSLASDHPQLQVRHNVNVNPWNADQVGDYLREVRARNEQCFISHYQSSSHYHHEQTHREAYAAFRDRLRQDPSLVLAPSQGNGFIGRRYLAFARAYHGSPESVQPLPCFALRAFANIESDGTVRPCINFPIDVGRLQEHDYRLQDLLRSPRADELRGRIRAGRCPGCWTPSEAYLTMLCNLPNPRLWMARPSGR